jgi:hypothetical protein
MRCVRAEKRGWALNDLKPTADVKEHYRRSVMNALGGFQLIEEHLKDYLGHYYNTVRHLLHGKVHFDYHRDDIRDAPLGKLIGSFVKVCANRELVSRMRSLVKHRDHAAHRALLYLYSTGANDDELHKLIVENYKLTEDVTSILDGINEELGLLARAIDVELD